jgi:hypothetical protein
MNLRITILGLLCTVLTQTDVRGQSDGHTQESRYKSFRVLIISPDTARIHDSLNFYVSSIELSFKETYYEVLREHQLKRTSGNVHERKQAKLSIRKAKSLEPDVVGFRYYQTISIATFVSLQEYFKKYPWEDKRSLDCQIVNRHDLETGDLTQLTKDYDLDYVIYFQDIVAEKYANSFIMDMTTYLFSKADSKIIMKHKASKEGEDLLCEAYNHNVLDCLMNLVVDEATSDLCEILSTRQKK